MRASEKKPLGLALFCGCLLLQHGCIDPFAGQSTTPDKVRGETAAGDKGKSGDEPSAGKGADGAARSKTDKAKKKEEKPKQTYREAWQLICDAEKHTSTSPDASRADRGAAVATWIVDNVTNKKARYWFIEFGKAKSQHKEALFRAEVEQVGIEPCTLLALLFPDPRSEGPNPSLRSAGGTVPPHPLRDVGSGPGDSPPTSAPAGDAGPSDGRAR